ncbi:MAG: type II secretion system F family protein [Nanoarchaeota archaeon]|nr:type II secretion system F family protein [Nanoarchaeota archaeon]
MYKNLKIIIDRILELLSEIERYEFYRNNLLETTQRIYSEYQNGMFSYEEYKKLLQSVLKSKSKKEWVDYYNSYIYSLLKQIEPLLSQIIYSVYQDKSAEHVMISEKHALKHAEKKHAKPHIEIEEAKESAPEKAPETEYEFVKVKRPSMVDKLREAVKPKDIPADISEPGEDSSLSVKASQKRRITSEEIEKRKGVLAGITESLKQRKNIPEAPRKRTSLYAKFKDYLFFKDIEIRKQSIHKKIERSKQPSFFHKIKDSLLSRRFKPEKAVPVSRAKPAKEPLLSKLSRAFAFGSRSEKVYSKEKELPSILQKKKPFSGMLSNLSLKARLAVLKMLPAKNPADITFAPQKKRKFFDALSTAVKSKEAEPKIILNPEDDKALKKLVENVDKINQEISEQRVDTGPDPLSIKLKIALIRFHFFVRDLISPRAKKTKREKPVLSEEPEPVPLPIAAKKKQGIAVPQPEKPSFYNALKSVTYNFVSFPSRTIKRAYSWVIRPGFKPEKLLKQAPEPKKSPIPAFEKPGVMISTSIFAPIKAWYRRLAEEEKIFISKKTQAPRSLQVEALKKKIVPLFEEEKVSSTLLTEEVDKIKGIMEQKKSFEIYQPSYYGSVANTLVRRFTFYIVDKFPGLFKKLYDQLRFANIKILSNTYVNMMMLSVMLSFIGSFILFSIFFIISNNPFFIIIPKSLMMSLVFSIVVFILFYMYPSIQASSREKSINTNLPFAINHVAAVAGSGVPPTKMFKLLVESNEYGEVASEFGKVVEYIDLFGYDLLTAIRSVSLTVPSAPLKEFLEGIVSTVESGSELKDYLKQKASEAMLAYELERQKYLETIATYSDIYTGILIAAPLFFIVSLSLVSMLGGTIGGMDINLIIVIGAYGVIPFLNIIFLAFIELTQPEV